MKDVPATRRSFLELTPYASSKPDPVPATSDATDPRLRKPINPPIEMSAAETNCATQREPVQVLRALINDTVPREADRCLCCATC